MADSEHDGARVQVVVTGPSAWVKQWENVGEQGSVGERRCGDGCSGWAVTPLWW